MICYCFLFFALSLIDIERKEFLDDSNDLFSLKNLENNKLIWQANLHYYSIYFHSTEKSFEKNSAYIWILLLLGGDIEVNPGPIQLNYSLCDTKLCSFYRVAIYCIFTGTKMIPTKDNPDQVVSLEEGIKDMKNIFGSQFHVDELDFDKLKKTEKRFLDLMSKWGKNRSREVHNTYLNTFSTTNWVKLDDSSKQKHSVCCEECNIDEIHATFPAGKQKVKKKTSNKRVHEECNTSLTNDLENFLDESFSKLHDVESDQPKRSKFGSMKVAAKDLTKKIATVFDNQLQKYFHTSFNENFQKTQNLEQKKSYEQKRKEKRDNFREATSTIKVDYDSNVVDRLYGARQSLRGWDADRKRKSFETVPDAKKRSLAKK